ncbi:unnamed protein product [Rotaria socialis]|uniref:DYW domain-containing protein n=3 Tax=Rotaria TaxID=231623 RepID=A0A821QC09_9BILA|nr:unnamed protein product [Rotaria socialis]
MFRRIVSLYQNLYKTSSISSSSLSSREIYSRMKQLMDSKEYKKTLDFFDQQSHSCTDFEINLALKACISLNEYQCGMNIQKTLSQNSLNNPYIQATLIQFYSESFISSITQLLLDCDLVMSIMLTITNKSNYIYATMLKGLISNNMPTKVLDLFDEMNIKSNQAILTVLFGACSRVTNDRAMKIGRKLLNQMPKNFLNDNKLLTSAINMLMRFGDEKADSVKDAQKIFKLIDKPDAITYTAMINSFGLNRMDSEAVDLYRKMPNYLQDEVSSVCVLNACYHSGLLNEAHSIFNEVSHKTKNIITAMSPFLFDEAQKLLEDYEKSNPPYSAMYMAILSGARDHEEAENIRVNRVKEVGKKFQVGLSWTEVNGEIVQLKAHDRSYSRSKEIYAEAERISSELIKHGHNYDSSWITRPLHENETTKSVLCAHSERLAIAFNFIQETKPSFIQITKNLSVCGDCRKLSVIFL